MKVKRSHSRQANYNGRPHRAVFNRQELAMAQKIKEKYHTKALSILMTFSNKRLSIERKQTQSESKCQTPFSLPKIPKNNEDSDRVRNKSLFQSQITVAIPLKPVPRKNSNQKNIFGWKSFNQSFLNNEYLSINKAGRSYSVISDKPKNEWLQILKQLKNTLQVTEQVAPMLPSSFWPYLIQKFQKYHIHIDEKVQLLQLISKFFQTNFRLSNRNTFQFCEQMGKKFQKLENRIFFKHKYCIQQIKFMVDRNLHKERFFSLHFPELKFNLEENQVFQIFSIVRNFCQNNMDSFAFLTLYFQISLKNKLKTQSFKKMEQDFTSLLKKLAAKYPANQQKLDKSKIQQGLQNIMVSINYQKLTFQKNGVSHFQQLKEMIIKKAEQAKKEETLFRELIEDICYKHGYGLKTDLKIKSTKSHASIFRTVQKMMSKDKFKGQFDILKKKLILEGSQSNRDSQLKIKQQIGEVQKKIEELLEKQSEITFDIKDLIRGKCTYSKIEEIIQTTKLLKQQITKSGHKVIEIKNRLNHHTKDVCLIIKLPHSIAQLQLVLKLDSVSNEFNHRIFELTRSDIHTLITNLFIHNERWCEIFFTNQFQLFESVFKMNRQPDLQQEFTFKRLRKDVDQFKKNYLETNEIRFEKSFHQQQQEKIKVIQKVKEIKYYISQLHSVSIGENQKEKMQKQNLINFCKSFDYEEALQKFDTIDQKQLERNLPLLKIKADILRQHGQFKQSLSLYEKYVKIRKPLNQQDIYLAQVFHCIGLIHDTKQQFFEAIENYQKSREIKQSIYGKHSIQVANSQSGIGQVYSNMKTKDYFEKALVNHKKALEIREKALGKESIEVTTSLNNLGVVYRRMAKLQKEPKQRQANLDKALELHKQALTIISKIRGRQSIDAATSLYNIGIAYHLKNDEVQALDYLNNSLEIRQKILGKSSIDAAKAHLYISYVYESLNYLQKAHNSIEVAYSIFKKLLTQDHSDTQLSLGQKQDLKGKLEKKQKLEALFPALLQLSKNKSEIQN